LSFSGPLFYKLLFKLVNLTSSVCQDFMLSGVVHRSGVLVTLPNELSPITNFNLFIVRFRLTGMLLRDVAAERNFFTKDLAAKPARIRNTGW